MRQTIAVILVYQLKSRVILRRAARCLTPCDSFLSPPPVMLSHLSIERNERDNSCDYNLLSEANTDSVETYKMA